MNNVLTKASKQLFNRPDDNCYQNMNSVIDFLDKRESGTRELGIDRIFAHRAGEGLFVDILPKGRHSHIITDMTDWSFGNLCKRLGAPARYLNDMSPDLAARCINEGIQRADMNKNGTVVNIADINEHPTARAFYTERYSRVPDLDVAQSVKYESDRFGYLPAGEFAGKRGGMAAVRPEASGVYASDRDVFFFFAHEEKPFSINGEELYHGFMVWNSEVTARSLGFCSFLYRFICGNHMVWGARDHVEMTSRHVGDPRKVLDSFSRIMEGYHQYRDKDREIIQARVTTAMNTEFADTRERAKDLLTKYAAISKGDAENSIDAAYSDLAYPKAPLSVWGVAQGITLHSQKKKWQESRVALDQFAGKFIESGVGF